MQSETLERLWQLADRIAGTQPGREDLGHVVFEPVGLILERPPVRYTYEDTPRNTTCFAHAGHDGVHYSFLHVDGDDVAELPIVMTAPAAKTKNLVVGVNLIEFLRLGCRWGYTDLDYLAVNLDEAVGQIEAAEELFDDLDESSQDLLDQLCMEFGLFSWHDIEGRLRELQTQFRDCVRAAEPK